MATEMKHSAYKSMRLGQEGKAKKPTKEKKGALQRWTDEYWVNLTAYLTDNKELACGTKGKRQKELNLPSVCRPKYKISKETPSPLSGDISKQKIRKAIEIKKKGERINWKDL